MVWTDGACRGNPGPGGWAWATGDGRSASGGAPDTTNQRMEVTAAFEAVRELTGPLEVRSDSTYVVNCFRDGWWRGWQSRGWRNSRREPVANRDLWEPFVELVRERAEVEFTWVKGHSGEPMNDLVDQMATAEADRHRSPSAAAPAPWFYLVAGAGSLTPEFSAWAERRGLEVLAAHKELHPSLIVLSGLRRGAEQVGARAALAAGVPVEAVLPWPDPHEHWSPAERLSFDDLLDRCSEVRILERARPPTVAKRTEGMARRDAWLARRVEGALVIGPAADVDVGSWVRRLETLVGEEIWELTPPD